MRARKATAALALVLLAGSCSANADIDVTFEQPTPAAPTATVAPSPSPTTQPSPSPTPTPAVSLMPTSPRESGAVVFRTEAGLVRLAADGTSVVLEGTPELTAVSLLTDGTTLGVGAGLLTRWSADGTAASVDCPCSGAVQMEDLLIGVGPAGELHRFTPDLTPVDVIESELVSEITGTRNDRLMVAGVAATGELVVSGHPTGTPPSAYGGPFTLWALDAQGRARLLTEVHGNLGPAGFAFSPDGGSLAYTSGFRLGACAHTEAVSTIDLVTGETDDLPLIWVPLGDAEPGEEQLLSNLIWADDGLYAVGAVAEGPPDDFDCASRWPPALWHHGGESWQIADNGPVAQVYPLDAESKVYVIADLPGAPGSLYWEREGQTTELATGATILASLPAQVSVELTSPEGLSAAARATRVTLLAAAASGSTRNLAEAAGDGFSFSLDPEAPTDPAEYWDELAECCDIDVPAIVGALLTRAPQGTVTVDGRPLASWAEPLDTGWRIAIDEAGNVWWIVDTGDSSG